MVTTSNKIRSQLYAAAAVLSVQTFSVSRNEKFWRRKNVWEQSIKRLWHFLKVKFQFNQRRRRTAALENMKSEIIWELMADISTSSGKKIVQKYVEIFKN